MRTVAITGASRGLGRAFAEGFAREGAFVYVGYRAREREATETLTRLREIGGDGAIWQIDVRNQDSVQRAFDGAFAARSQIDVLVNNAGVASDAPFGMMSPGDWDAVIETNLTGAFRCARAVVRPMMAARSGVIINVASVAGIHAVPGQANYAASKGGLIAMTRTLAVETAAFGIRVNAVVPGFATAGMAVRMDRTMAEQRMAQIPVKRFATPEEIASVVVFLASDGSRYIIGQAIVVDGGLGL